MVFRVLLSIVRCKLVWIRSGYDMLTPLAIKGTSVSMLTAARPGEECRYDRNRKEAWMVGVAVVGDWLGG